MKSKFNLIAALCFILILGAHGYSKSKDGISAGKEQVYSSSNENMNIEKQGDKSETSQNSNFVTVKNEWRFMPSFDRYGNRITPRARYNMMQNEMLNKLNKNKSAGKSMNAENK